MVDKPCAKRVGDDVSSHGFKIFLTPQGSVEVAFLPYGSIWISFLIDQARAARFGGLYQFWQITVVQFNQPVEVIRHDYPGYGGGMAGFLSPSELMHQKTARTPILEERLSFMGDGGQVIDTTGLRVSTGA